MKNNYGFTLIELLVAVTIVGILATTGLFLLNPTRIMKKNRDTKRLADLRQIQGALEMYRSDNGGYPDTAELSVLEDELAEGSVEYVKKLPEDPSDDLSYEYDGTSVSDYVICACLELEESVDDGICETVAGLIGCDSECCVTKP